MAGYASSRLYSTTPSPAPNAYDPGYGALPPAPTTPQYGSYESMPSALDNEEAAALMYAAESGAVRSLTAWMRRGGDINAACIPLALPTPLGRSDASGGMGASSGREEAVPPLIYAAGSGHATAVRVLLEVGARNSRALSVACQGGHTAAVEALLEAGYSPDTPDEWGQTPLHYAAALGHTPAARQLLRYGADASAREATGRTAFDLALAAGHADTCAVLRSALDRSRSGAGPSGRMAALLASGAGSPLAYPDTQSRLPPPPPATAQATPAYTYSALSHSRPTAAATPFAATGTTSVAAAAVPVSVKASDSGLSQANRAQETHPRLQAWLTFISLSHLFPAFIFSGFDDVDFIASVGLSDTDVDCVLACVPAHMTYDLPPGSRRKLTSLFNIAPFLTPAAAAPVESAPRAAVSPVSTPRANEDTDEDTDDGDDDSDAEDDESEAESEEEGSGGGSEEEEGE